MKLNLTIDSMPLSIELDDVIAGLLAVAAVGMIIGGTLDTAGLHRAMVAGALLLLVGGVVSGIGIRNGVHAQKVQTVTD